MSRPLRAAAMAGIAALQAAWLGWFLLEPLPNAGNAGGRGLRRLDLLLRAVPEVVPGVRFRDSYLGLALGELRHVENLPQRLPIVAAAGSIALACLATGSLALRGLGARAALGRLEVLGASWLLGTVGVGSITLMAGRMGWLAPAPVRWALAVPIAAEVAAGLVARRQRAPALAVAAEGSAPGRRSWWSVAGFAVVVGPFLAIMALGAMLPTIDFDAIEYHVEGPKEYFQAGRIAFLPHNVYTSMPFGIEMLHLLGMEALDDWWLGALAGQLLVAAYAPIAALFVGLAAARVGSPRAAWVAAVAYLTTPWVYRLAVLPYVEGPLCAFHAALIWAAARWGGGIAVGPLRFGLLAGALAGGAMATKYPALVSAVAPGAAWAAWASARGRSARPAIGYAAGVAAVMAPWLVKNLIDAGNPVYPLGYAVFGGRGWDAAMDAKWANAHGPRPIGLAALVQAVGDVAGRSDWQSPLFAALGPLAFVGGGSRRAAGWIAAYSAYLFLTWWTLTHRLDRFWLPMLPGLAILAGLGADRFRSVAGRAWLAGVIGLAVVANATYCSTALAGLNQWLGDLRSLRREVPRMLNPPLVAMDAMLPEGAKVLLVGQAAVFHLDRPIAYNTVFNREGIEEIARGRPPAEVGRILRERGFAAVYVDWFEVERYRSPGNYGFTPFVTPGLFADLIEAGILGPPARPGHRQELYRVRPPAP